MQFKKKGSSSLLLSAGCLGKANVKRLQPEHALQIGKLFIALCFDFYYLKL